MMNVNGDQTGRPSGAAITDEVVTASAVRVSPHSYIAALLVASFFCSFLFYLENNWPAIVLFAVSWIGIPYLALKDRIVFDGRRLKRDGLVPILWAWLGSTRRSLKLADVEQVETHALRTVRRGGSVYYRYRTVFRGRGIKITVASGGERYRDLLAAVLPSVNENALDNRSLEMRNYLADPKEVIMRAEFSRIPSASFLEQSFRDRMSERRADRSTTIDGVEDPEKVEDMRSLGNTLKIAGQLLPALEAFRRALNSRPRDARLLFDFARCLHSYAMTEKDHRLERRALAALRLSERHSEDDGDLLARLGEWYSQIGEWRRAELVFQRALDRIGVNFLAARGMAEVALRDGKVAHVIHHFQGALNAACTSGLRRWSRNEAEYFSNLNHDDEYMELEVTRVGMLETVERSRKTTLRIMFFGIPTTMFGLSFEDPLVANIGWAVSMVAIVTWLGLTALGAMLSRRIPYHLMGSDD